jgi:hypothetical protein
MKEPIPLFFILPSVGPSSDIVICSRENVPDCVFRIPSVHPSTRCFSIANPKTSGYIPN